MSSLSKDFHRMIVVSNAILKTNGSSIDALGHRNQIS
jgi:lambda repressor-like predicted transcriptional regulator